jgi:hypothetical protein
MKTREQRSARVYRDLAALLDESPEQLADDALLADLALWEKLGRLTDAARAQRSAEVAHRSRVELGDSGLAKVNNFPTVTKLIAAAAGPDLAKLNGAAPTLNVYVTLEELRAGRGVGWVDGIVDPVTISTFDHLLCHSDFIATVFGQNGQVLHHGKTRRLFDAKQNRALAARDGGCVWPSCDRPPSWCESHHVEDWRSADYAPGRTDIDNGALLCHFITHICISQHGN